MDVLGSIFSGKMVFENGKCRTAEFNPTIAILMGREPFFNEKGASVDTETPLLYPMIFYFRTSLFVTYLVFGHCEILPPTRKIFKWVERSQQV